MNLTELYSRLSYGQLSNLSMAETTPGDIVAGKRPSIVLYLNDAMKKLHERFILKEKGMVIRVVEGKLDYILNPTYSTTGATPPTVPYILDTEQDPFLGDVVCILEAWDSQGRHLPLNDSSRDYSLFTPQADIIQIPNQEIGNEVSLSYQAYPADIILGSSEAISIPVGLEPALTSWIAYKVYSNMNTQESTAKARDHLAEYESICISMEQKNILSTSNVSSTSRFDLNGWV